MQNGQVSLAFCKGEKGKQMNSKERVMTTFHFEEPDRVPVWCGASPEFMHIAKTRLQLPDNEAVSRRFGDDFRRVYAAYAGPDDRSPDKCLPPGATGRTPFGVLRHGYGYGQPLNHPLANATLEELEAFPWPRPEWMSAVGIRRQAEQWQGEFAVLGGDWSPFWHDAIDLMGMETLMIRLYEEPETVEALLGHIMDYYAGVNEQILAEAGDVIDILFIGNDLGSQTGPLIGPECFDRFLLPHFKRLSSIAQQHNLKVMLHCCGGIEPLIPSLLASGIHALQALQPDAAGMDPASLKAVYGKQMVLNGGLDSHNVLIDGTPELTRRKTRELLEIMMPGGGFILSPSHDYLLAETPLENALALYDAAREYGRYRSASDAQN